MGDTIKTSHTGRNALIGGALLGLFAVVASGLVASTYRLTVDRIAENEKQAILRTLHEVANKDQYDNDLVNDAIQLQDEEYLGSKKPLTAWRGRLAGKPTVIIMTVVAPRGYSGEIKLLVGIDMRGVITGVRVVSHRETPGLGDAIEQRRSNWIRGFDGRSLDDPLIAGWKVKRDGGVFDQLTGATVTPRAVVRACLLALQYFKLHQATLFSADTKEPGAQYEPN